jgi:uncharacterized protein YegJ (DUF2314 family)
MKALVLALPMILGLLLFVALLARPWRMYVEARAASRSGTALPVTNDDRALAQAEAEARATLPDFLVRLASPRPGDSEFMVKFRLRAGKTPEQIWAEQLRRRDGRLYGRLANDPVTRGLSFDQEVEIPEREIIDWGFRDNGVMQGHFSTRVFLERMPETVQADVRKDFGWDRA